VLLTPDAGELVGHFRSPGELVAAASTHVDGAPVTVGVTREPLAVVIFQ
jgi:hypothetical protein